MKDLIQPSTPIDGQLQVTQVQAVAETWSPQHVLSWAFQTFGKNVAVSSAFGAEGMVLIDMASRISKDFRLFTIDTEFLFLFHAIAGRPTTSAWRGVVGQQPRSMLQFAQGGTAAPQARRIECVDHEHPSGSDNGTFRRETNRVGCEVRAGESQPHRGLDIEASVALHPRP